MSVYDESDPGHVVRGLPPDRGEGEAQTPEQVRGGRVVGKYCGGTEWESIPKSGRRLSVAGRVLNGERVARARGLVASRPPVLRGFHARRATVRGESGGARGEQGRGLLGRVRVAQGERAKEPPLPQVDRGEGSARRTIPVSDREFAEAVGYATGKAAQALIQEVTLNATRTESENTAKKGGKTAKVSQRHGRSLRDIVIVLLSKAREPVQYRDLVAAARKEWAKEGKAEAASFAGQVWHAAKDVSKIPKRGFYVLNPKVLKPENASAKKSGEKKPRQKKSSPSAVEPAAPAPTPTTEA